MRCVLMLAALAGLTVCSSYSFADDRLVPAEYDDIGLGIAAATPNVDRVVVSNKDADPLVAYEEAVGMVSGVPVIAAEGHTPIIDAGSMASIAVNWPFTANSNTILEGFTVRGGTQTVVYVRDQGVVRDCLMDNEGTSGRTYGIRSVGGTVIENCRVTMTGSQQNYGINHMGGSPSITNCTVDVSQGFGIYVDCPSATTSGSILESSVTMGAGSAFYLGMGAFTVSDASAFFDVADYDNIGFSCGYSVGLSRFTLEDSFAHVPDGIGVYVADDSVKVRNLTVDGVGTGIMCAAQADVTVENCIVTHYRYGAEYAYDNVNAIYCIGDGDEPYESGSQGTGSMAEDPLYCDPGAGDFTLRIDSYGNPGNNDSEKLIGAFGVACAGGELVRDTGFDGQAVVLEDLIVPAGLELALLPGARLQFDEEDESGGGNNANLNELLVSGDLTVSGSSGNPVRFEPLLSTPVEGAWGGVVINSTGEGTLSDTEVRGAEVGLTSLYAGTLTISNCLFEENESIDLNLKRGAGGALDVVDNTIQVGDGIGIKFESTDDDGSNTIADNTLTLNGSTDVGIQVLGIGPLGAVSNNSVSGGSAAYGIESTGEGNWLIQSNSVTSCSVGIRAARSSGSDMTGIIGGIGSGSGNSLTYCTTAISASGSKVKSRIRYNAITNNSKGLVARLEAYPDAGHSGVTGDGNNTFLSNSSYCIQNSNSTPQSALLAQGNYFGFTDCENPEVPSCTSGWVDVTNVLCTSPNGVSMAIEALQGEPLVLRGAAPNPMTAGTQIAFTLSREADLHVEIFDLAGRRVRDLGSQHLVAGTHFAEWDGSAETGVAVGNGLYFARVTAGSELQKTAKILVTR